VTEWAGPVANFGIAGLILFFAYRLIDKWAGPFLEAHGKLAGAMTMLAESVKQSSNDSREILLAVRVQSAMIGDLKALIEERLKQ
jgi:hypothetical protein